MFSENFGMDSSFVWMFLERLDRFRGIVEVGLDIAYDKASHLSVMVQMGRPH